MGAALLRQLRLVHRSGGDPGGVVAAGVKQGSAFSDQGSDEGAGASDRSFNDSNGSLRKPGFGRAPGGWPDHRSAFGLPGARLLADVVLPAFLRRLFEVLGSSA
jgi:hypothetical protein